MFRQPTPHLSGMAMREKFYSEWTDAERAEHTRKAQSDLRVLGRLHEATDTIMRELLAEIAIDTPALDKHWMIEQLSGLNQGLSVIANTLAVAKHNASPEFWEQLKEREAQHREWEKRSIAEKHGYAMRESDGR